MREFTALTMLLFVFFIWLVAAATHSDGYVASVVANNNAKMARQAEITERQRIDEMERTERQRIRSNAFSENLDMVLIALLILVGLCGAGGGLFWFINKQSDRAHEQHEQLLRATGQLPMYPQGHMPQVGYMPAQALPPPVQPQYTLPDITHAQRQLIERETLEKIMQHPGFEIVPVEDATVDADYYVKNLETNEARLLEVK